MLRMPNPVVGRNCAVAGDVDFGDRRCKQDVRQDVGLKAIVDFLGVGGGLGGVVT